MSALYCADCKRTKGYGHATWCHLEMVRKIQHDTWAVGYWQGVADDRTAADLNYEFSPNRDNPYRDVPEMWIEVDD